MLDTSHGRDMIADVKRLRVVVVYMVFYIAQIIANFYTFCFAFATLAAFNLKFSLLFLVLTIPGVLLDKHFDMKTEELRRKQAPDIRKFSYYRWILTDVGPAKDVRTYNLTEPLTARYNEEKQDYVESNKKMDKKKLLASLPVEIIVRSGEIAFTFL